MEKKIKVVFVSCFFIYLVDCIFLAINKMLIDCLFLVLLPLASIGALKLYSLRNDEQRAKEDVAWFAIGISSVIISLMLLYISLGYENQRVILAMEFISATVVLVLFKIISDVKYKR